MKYPKEAPVFRVLENAGAPCPVGEDVVAVNFWKVSDRSNIVWFHALYPSYTYDCEQTWLYNDYDLEPLTPAAEEMLAVARERSGAQ